MRSAEAEVAHGPCANPDRRAACLADPKLFLKTYMAERFYNPWADHHIEMIAAIEYAAKYGGDQAIAAPRGDGKTEICTAMIVWAILAGFVKFPVIVASTSDFAHKIFKDVKAHLENNDLLAADFPEVCTYIRDLEGAPSRANKQHNGGVRTRIVWTADEAILPTIAGSIYGGVTLAYKGLDAAIRGIRSRGKRPDFVLIDDPETKESAKSDTQVHDRTLSIERDIAGLGGPDKSLPCVMLTTIQNRKCLSFTFTDPKLRPSWNGKRFRAVVRWPNNPEMWDEYIALRQQDQQNRDSGQDLATEYYRANREAMDDGAVVGNPYRKLPGTLSALQTFYNQIADKGLGFALAELQNDPEDDDEELGVIITPGVVQRRMSGYTQKQLPKAEGVRIVAGLDIGKYWSHWVKIALYGNAIGHIIDYGIMETPGVSEKTEENAIEQAILKSLELWRIDMISESEPELCFVDSGDYSEAIYEFVRRYGSPFVAAKGWEGGRLKMSGENSRIQLFFQECRADFQPAEKLWLYNFDSWHWKGEVHKRFMTETYSEANIINDGSLSVWSTESRKEHLMFSQHICAEVREEKFVEGKGLIRKWVKKKSNNHWLDATANALAAGGCLGIRVVPRTSALIEPESKPKQTTTPPHYANRFRNRPGGWVKGMRR